MSVNLSLSVAVCVSLCVRDLYVMIHRADCPGDDGIVVVVVALKYISGMA